MSELTLWRIELLHPFVIHVPIATLAIAEIALLVRCVLDRNQRESSINSLILFLLLVGVPTAWLAVWSGEQAHDVVNRVICDPTQTKDHEWFAQRAVWIFSAVLFLELCNRYRRRAALPQPAVRTAVKIFSTLLASIAFYLLIRAAHLGASLVYLQGAGVHRSSDECTEFE